MFQNRHIGPSPRETEEMLDFLGLDSIDQLMKGSVPESIRSPAPMGLRPAATEWDCLEEIRTKASKNRVFRSLLGMGYHETILPPVIQRAVLENPGWYTQYTPYQSEISQGRLEALINFQTLVTDLTGLEIANASLLDEATAAAEAMAMSFSVKNRTRKKFFVDQGVHPQTLDVLRTRAEPLGIEIEVGSYESVALNDGYFGTLVQLPNTRGSLADYSQFIEKTHQVGALATVAADLLALTLIRSPGEMGADIAVGSTQRLGVPLGYGGPHAAFFATKNLHQRRIPGRIVGVSKDARGETGYRLAIQTREQHIRRDKATSNICTAQVLLAILSSMYAVYHGPEGLKNIARRIHALTRQLASGLSKLGFKLESNEFFDTITVRTAEAAAIHDRARKRHYNLRDLGEDVVGLSLDEVSNEKEVTALLEIFSGQSGENLGLAAASNEAAIPSSLQRTSSFLTHKVFTANRSESEMLRYIKKLESRDLSLTTSMIPLGSCTMKLNSAAEMFPVTWPEFSRMHPFAPVEQAEGYQELIRELEEDLARVTGFDATSVQPNAGSQGEYSGLLVIKKYLESKGEGRRNICLIPKSAHGTNPASAAMVGMKVLVVGCDSNGNVDLADLKAKAEANSNDLAALMITYPSTHGVFEESIREVCEIIHQNGGQVYMDGANMNAQIGYCRPPEYGADVCHLNLHKTFAIPHGGGGPGVGPICVKKHLAPFLPGHFVYNKPGEKRMGPVAAAPWGSAGVLPISWSYIRMLGDEGLTRCTEIAILNANYIAKRLEPHFPVLYKGKNGWVAHECIVDLRMFKSSAGVEVEDVAKRLMDYGFHAPTVSFPVPGTMMIEPTESESKAELDCFCDAMIGIRKEIEAIESGKADRKNNLLKNAPHSARMIASDAWDFPYSREQAAYPAAWLKDYKYWPPVARIDNVYGDRNLFCTCAPE